MDRDEALELLCQVPATTGILTDFDGSLAPIVDLPADAVAVAGAHPAMESLARTFRLVAVVSGRSLEDLRDRFTTAGVVLCGSYGRERSDIAAPRRAPEGWEMVVVAASARVRGLTGVVVEPKGLGVSLHYRLAPRVHAEVELAAADLAREFGLEVRPGRLVVELTVPGPGKAEVICDLAADYGLTRVLFAGDDLADLEAFDRLREIGQDAVLVGVSSPESPAGLRAAADILVASPEELVEFLTQLASRSGST